MSEGVFLLKKVSQLLQGMCDQDTCTERSELHQMNSFLV